MFAAMISPSPAEGHDFLVCVHLGLIDDLIEDLLRQNLFKHHKEDIWTLVLDVIPKLLQKLFPSVKVITEGIDV